VQGTAGDLLGRGADLATEPRRDLVGGLVGECDSADAGRREPLAGDEVPDAGDQAVRLARARAGDDEDRAEGGLDCAALGIGRGQGQGGDPRRRG
jgi:hypothetical protein